MRNLIISLIIALSSVLTLHADTCRVNASVLNVRATSSPSGSVIGTLAAGETVEVISEDDGWAAIQYDGRRGYVKASFLIPADSGAVSETSDGSDGPIHRFLSIFSNDGEAAWFSIVKWILIVIVGSVLLRYGLSLLAHMAGFGFALGAAGLLLGALLYWLGCVEERTMWNMGTYGFYAGCGLALIYLVVNFREWSDDARSIIARSPSTTTNVDSDGRKHFTVHDERGISHHLTQDSKYSESRYTDEHGKYWVRDNSGFRRL